MPLKFDAAPPVRADGERTAARAVTSRSIQKMTILCSQRLSLSRDWIPTRRRHGLVCRFQERRSSTLASSYYYSLPLLLLLLLLLLESSTAKLLQLARPNGFQHSSAQLLFCSAACVLLHSASATIMRLCCILPLLHRFSAVLLLCRCVALRCIVASLLRHFAASLLRHFAAAALLYC